MKWQKSKKEDETAKKLETLNDVPVEQLAPKELTQTIETLQYGFIDIFAYTISNKLVAS